MNDKFLAVYIKDNKAYNVALNLEQVDFVSNMIRDVVLPSVLKDGEKIIVFGNSIGEVMTVGEMKNKEAENG